MQDVKNNNLNKRCKEMVEIAVEHADLQLNWQSTDLNNSFVMLTLFVTLAIAIGPALASFASTITTLFDALLFLITVIIVLVALFGFMGFYSGKINLFSLKKDKLVQITHWGRLILRFWNKTTLEEVDSFFELCLSEPKLTNSKTFKQDSLQENNMKNKELLSHKLNNFSEKLISKSFSVSVKATMLVLILALVLILLDWARVSSSLDINSIILGTTAVVVFIATLSLLCFQYAQTLDKKEEKDNYKSAKAAGESFLYTTMFFIFGLLFFAINIYLQNNPLISQFSLEFTIYVAALGAIIFVFISIVSFVSGLFDMMKAGIKEEEA
jgi:hypothetical protein